ncbi:MAG: 3-oxoadipate CoA-transferase, partial [Chloroflexota bacterium]|nr:3-oxoadipate CoA-transferase [Chloroflexota bacterium]
AEGKPIYELDGRQYVVERPIHADFAFISAWKADPWGNLGYRYAQQNFNPLMAMAARCTVAQVDQLVGLGELEPMSIQTPGIFVTRVVKGERAIFS